MDAPPVTIFIVDDDRSVRHALSRLLHASGYETRAYGSAVEFLAAYDRDCNGCVILDVAMPEFGGFELQEYLNASGWHPPLIFLTGCGNIPMSVRAMKAGAVTFLTKPVEARELVAAVNEALRLDAARRRARSARHDVQKRLAMLTPRERQVLERVVAGRLNKQIAAELGIVEKTVKVHRARAMKKMGARSLAELIWLSACVGVDVRPVLPYARAADACDVAPRRPATAHASGRAFVDHHHYRP
jgi:FixJ family two-component response regulator